MDSAHRMYSKLLALIPDPLNLSPYMYLWEHISAYMFFSVFPTYCFRCPIHRLWLCGSLYRDLFEQRSYQITSKVWHSSGSIPAKAKRRISMPYSRPRTVCKLFLILLHWGVCRSKARSVATQNVVDQPRNQTHGVLLLFLASAWICIALLLWVQTRDDEIPSLPWLVRCWGPNSSNYSLEASDRYKPKHSLIYKFTPLAMNSSFDLKWVLCTSSLHLWLRTLMS